MNPSHHEFRSFVSNVQHLNHLCIILKNILHSGKLMEFVLYSYLFLSHQVLLRQALTPIILSHLF